MTLAVSLLLSLSTVCASVVRTGDSVVIGVCRRCCCRRCDHFWCCERGEGVGVNICRWTRVVSDICRLTRDPSCKRNVLD